MRVHPKLFLKKLLALIIWFFLALTSCEQKTQEPKGPVNKVSLAYATSTSAVLAHIALKQGYFADAGLEVAPQPHFFGKSALNAVIEGKADFATVAETPIMFASLSGKKIRIIAEIQTSNKNAAIIARHDLGITNVLDLKGKKIGVKPGTTAEFFMDAFFLVHGINRQEVKIIDMNPEEMSDALTQGRVDAVSIWNPLLKELQNGLGDKGITFFEENIYTEFFCAVTGQEFAEKNPGVIKKFLQALIKAEAFVLQHPAESKQIVAEYTRTDKAIIDDLWDDIEPRVTLDQLLLVTLEDQTRWAKKAKLTNQAEMPNYLEVIYCDGLQAVKPEAVRIIR